MTKSALEAEAILKRAAPLTHQQAHEIQPFGHLVRMPIALSEQTCKESVDNLDQLLADTVTLQGSVQENHWQIAGRPFISCISCSTGIERVVDVPLTTAV